MVYETGGTLQEFLCEVFLIWGMFLLEKQAISFQGDQNGWTKISNLNFL